LPKIARYAFIVNSLGNSLGGSENISVFDLMELKNIHSTGKLAYIRPIASPA